jgi:hypothetical protein
MKRILDCRGSDFRQMGRNELKQAIRATEGRTILAETVVTSQPLIPEVSNPEVMKAFGADMILLNMFDCFNPVVNGVESHSVFQPNAAGSEVDENIIQKIKELTGLPVGINLEPVDPHANALEKLHSLPEGRTATENSLAMAKQLGCDFICLTGNPKSGVTNEKIEQAIILANKHFGGLIIAGKMHNAGTAGSMFDLHAFSRFAESGADVIYSRLQEQSLVFGRKLLLMQ